MAAVVGIISRCELGMDACHRNRLNKIKPVLYKLLLWLLFNSYIMGMSGLPDIYTRSPRVYISGEA